MSFKYTKDTFVYIDASDRVWHAEEFPAPIRKAAGLVTLTLERMREAPELREAAKRRALELSDRRIYDRSRERFRPGFWINPDYFAMRVDADFMDDYRSAVSVATSLFDRIMND